MPDYGHQLLFGTVLTPSAEEAGQVVAAGIMWRLFGFHPLLLPTFLIE